MANIKENNISIEQSLKELLEENNLPEVINTWKPSYNKRADMFEAGTKYPVGSFYFPIEDTGVMLRIDDDNKIYGFAIENAKLFMKENPEFVIPLSYFISPFKFWMYYIPMLLISIMTMQTFLMVKSLTQMKVFADYIAGRAMYDYDFA